MTSSMKIDTGSVPTKVGIARTVQIPATRYSQDGRTFYSTSVAIGDLVSVIEMPDPDKPLEDNRVVQPSRARAFGIDYLLDDDDRYGWVCPPMMVRADPNEIKVADVIHEFDNGVAWVLLEVQTALAWQILDGQHRALGFKFSLAECAERIRDLRRTITKMKQNDIPEKAIVDTKAKLQFYLDKLESVSSSHVPVALVEAMPEIARQMFVDIARNAKGVNPDFTTVLDQRSVAHRIAMTLMDNHPLLAGRVEIGQSSRISRSNPNLIGAKTVADIVHGVLVGSGRISRRREHEIAREESLNVQRVSDFFDSLVAGFDDLGLVVKGDLDPRELRQESLLGSGTMFRVLAIAWHELRKGDQETGVKEVAVGEIEEFYRELSPHLRAFEDVEIEDPLTKEKSARYGVPEGHPLWTSTLGFIAGQKAPSARQGSIKPLSQQLANWARSGLPK